MLGSSPFLSYITVVESYISIRGSKTNWQTFYYIEIDTAI